MTFLKLDHDIVLNQDAIAFIQFSSDEGVQQAAVHFLVPQIAHGEWVTHVFTGKAVEALRNLSKTLGSAKDEGPAGEETGPDAIDFAAVHIRKKKGWFFVRSGNRGVILAFVSAKGSCSVRSYDAQTGLFLGRTYKAGEYQDSFSDLLSGAVELTLDSQPNLERDCRERLPDRTLSYLKSQINTNPLEESR